MFLHMTDCCLQIPVSSGGSILPWNSGVTIALLTVGTILTVVFVVVEWKFARLPMTPLWLFSSLSRSTLLAENFLFGFVWQADLYFLPIYHQDVCGFTPIKSAYLTLPLLLAQSVAGVCSGPAMSWTARCVVRTLNNGTVLTHENARYMPVLWAGFVLWTIGAGLKLLFSRSTSIAIYVIAVFIEGAGVGFVFQPCEPSRSSINYHTR